VTFRVLRKFTCDSVPVEVALGFARFSYSPRLTAAIW